MRILFLAIQIFVCTVALAQPGPPPPDPERVPITGIELLLVGGGAYGVYRASRKRKNNSQE